jgi:hypothetical protein
VNPESLSSYLHGKRQAYLAEPHHRHLAGHCSPCRVTASQAFR